MITRITLNQISNKMSIIFSIEGNIGSGKSTLFQILKKSIDPQEIKSKRIIFLEEPVDEWSSIQDKTSRKTILDLFYGNMKEYAFSFQMMAYITRLKNIQDTIKKYPNSIIITERCLYTDKNIFAKMLYDDGIMKSVEYQIYSKWFSHFIKDFPKIYYIFLNTKPSICLERIQKRNRGGENNIAFDYLLKLDRYHHEWLFRFNTASQTGLHRYSMLELSGDKQKENTLLNYKDELLHIHQFINAYTKQTFRYLENSTKY